MTRTEARAVGRGATEKLADTSRRTAAARAATDRVHRHTQSHARRGQGAVRRGWKGTQRNATQQTGVTNRRRHHMSSSHATERDRHNTRRRTEHDTAHTHTEAEQSRARRRGGHGKRLRVVNNRARSGAARRSAQALRRCRHRSGGEEESDASQRYTARAVDSDASDGETERNKRVVKGGGRTDGRVWGESDGGEH